MSNLINHAKNELSAMGYNADDVDAPNKWMRENVLELLEVFSKQGHSGMSAPHCISMFKTLASFEPLGPLTGEDSEWTDAGWCFQNNRCPHVFKRKEDGQAYDAEGKIFRYPDGSCFTSSASSVEITFPYTPKREYVDVPYDE